MALNQSHKFNGRTGSEWIKASKPVETSYRVYQLVAHGYVLQETQQKSLFVIDPNTRQAVANLSISAYAYDDLINRLLYCERGCSAGEEQMVNNITADGNDPDDYFGPPEIY